jgi:hypothetical protein
VFSASDCDIDTVAAMSEAPARARVAFRIKRRERRWRRRDDECDDMAQPLIDCNTAPRRDNGPPTNVGPTAPAFP